MQRTDFGKNLRALREDAGLTQERLAELIGCNPLTISSWENRNIKHPRKGCDLDSLLEIFKVTERELLGGSDGYYANSRGLVSLSDDSFRIDSSMEPSIPYGAVIRYQNADLKDGDLAVVVFDGEPTVRRISFHDGLIILKADNAKRTIVDTDSGESLEILGKAVSYEVPL